MHKVIAVKQKGTTTVKKMFALLLGICVAFVPLRVFAYENVQYCDLSAITQVSLDVPAVTPMEENAISLPVKSAVLMELETGNILYQMQPDTQLPPASVTKIMTLLLTMEALDQGKFSLEDMVTPSEHACSMGGSQIWLKPDEQMSVNDLLKATAIASANDAAVALGELVAGSEEAFVAEMNEKCKELGMNNTTFVNATGLDATGHITTARDIAIMSRELLLNYPKIEEYSTVWMESLRGGATQLVNTNRLVRFYDGCIGLKTGTTSGAGYCVSAAAKRGDMTLIAVVMGADNTNDRFAAARSLLDMGFANYEVCDIPLPKEMPTALPVKGGISKSAKISVSAMSEKLLVGKGESTSLVANVQLAQQLKAPVKAGQQVGSVSILNGDKVVCEYQVTASEDIAATTFWYVFKNLAIYTIRML